MKGLYSREMEREIGGYLKAVQRLLGRLQRINRKPLDQAARRIAETLEQDGLIHVFGTGHSSLIAQEAFFRAGGLININPMIELPFMVYHRPMGAARIERTTAPADGIFRRHKVASRDVCILASNSGRNVLPVEVALRMKKKGVSTIGISSLKHARNVPSRHPTRKNLVEVVDIVLDNGGAYGDAAVKMPWGASMGPTSAIAAFALLHAVLVGGAARAARRGHPPTVLQSANLKGKKLSDYEKLFRRYCRRIRWLR